MTATAAGFGLKPVFHPSGQAPQSARTITSGYATAIYKYDPVSLQTDGTIGRTASGVSNGLVGVFLGCEFTPTDGSPRRTTTYWPASQAATDIVAYVTEDPSIIYEIQADGSVTQANVGEQTVFNSVTGDTTTLLGKCTLKSADLSASTASQFRVVGFGRGADNAAGDTYTIVRVEIALHQFRNRQGPF